jgi:CheY-like chemotaxis protein
MAKILVTDDDKHIRLLYSVELEEAGYEVVTADSG